MLYADAFESIGGFRVMLCADELNDLLSIADSNPNKVGEALSVMLDAEIYLYVHLDSSATEAGIFQVLHPRYKLLVVPFFSDKLMAEGKTDGRVKVLAYPCRRFFKQTIGATLLLDPQYRDCLLFPNEVAALLAGVYTSGPLPVRPDNIPPIAIAHATAGLPSELATVLRALFLRTSVVHACHVSMLHQEGGLSPSVLLFTCTAEPSAHAHVKRVILEAVKPFLELLGQPIDLLMRAPSDETAVFLSRCLYEKH